MCPYQKLQENREPPLSINLIAVVCDLNPWVIIWTSCGSLIYNLVLQGLAQITIRQTDVRLLQQFCSCCQHPQSNSHTLLHCEHSAKCCKCAHILLNVAYRLIIVKVFCRAIPCCILINICILLVSQGILLYWIFFSTDLNSASILFIQFFV